MSVLSHLTNTSNNLVLSSAERTSIDSSISTLSIRLRDYFGSDVKEQMRFGSSTRGTILPRKADIHSDIDYMILFNNDANYRPQTFIDRLKRFAQAKYSTSQIAQSHPTITLSLNHIKFDLVPAYKNWWHGIQIPAPRSDYSDWMTTDPNGFNGQLTTKNQNNQNLIKPMVRLVKYWNAQNGYIYDSYLLEKDLVSNSYWFCSNLKAYFFDAMEHLPTSGLSLYNTTKVDRARKIIQQVKEYEANDMPASAESEIKKLIPVVY